MKAQAVTFVEAGKVELREHEVSAEGLGANEVVVKTLYSVVSAGTELAILRGTESWAKLPTVPGYVDDSPRAGHVNGCRWAACAAAYAPVAGPLHGDPSHRGIRADR